MYDLSFAFQNPSLLSVLISKILSLFWPLDLCVSLFFLSVPNLSLRPVFLNCHWIRKAAKQSSSTSGPTTKAFTFCLMYKILTLFCFNSFIVHIFLFCLNCHFYIIKSIKTYFFSFSLCIIRKRFITVFLGE